MTDKSDESFIMAPKDLGEALIAKDIKGITRFLESPGTAIAETLTGLMQSEKSLLATGGEIAGKLLQGALKGRLYEQLGSELEELRSKGAIADDPGSKKHGWNSWSELLNAIDQDVPDDDRFEALKAMFFDVNRVTASDKDGIVSYQLMKLARQLSSGELLLLKAIYQAYRQSDLGPRNDHWENWDTWASRINNHYGNVPQSLLRLNEKQLEQLELISGRHPTEHHRVTTENNRITDLGVRFCKNIEDYISAKK